MKQPFALMQDRPAQIRCSIPKKHGAVITVRSESWSSLRARGGNVASSLLWFRCGCPLCSWFCYMGCVLEACRVFNSRSLHLLLRGMMVLSLL